MLKKSRQFISDNRILVAIFLFTLLLRLIVIEHSFPSIIHPDEPTVVRGALRVRFYSNPMHFDWPHLFIYLNFFVYMVFAKLRDILTMVGLKETVSAMFPLVWNDDLIFYLITRIFAAFLGALTVFPVYLTAKKLFNERAAILSAFVMALLPFHIWHSQYSLIDVPMTFFLAISMFFSTLILSSNRTRYYILAGLFVGLAASTKYNGGLAALMVVTAHLLRVYVNREKLFELTGIKNLLLSGMFAVLGFLIGTPYALLDFDTFTRTDGPKGALWQFKNVGKVSLGTQVTKFFYLFFTQLPNDFGYTPLMAYLAVVIALPFRKLTKINISEVPQLVFLIIPSLLYFFYVAGFAKSRSHYYFMTYPLVAITAGYFIYTISNFLTTKYNKRLQVLFLLAFFIWPFTVIVQNTIKRLESYNTPVEISVDDTSDVKEGENVTED